MPTAIRREIGQLLIGSLPGTTITPEIRSLARDFSLGGIILFSRNIEAPEQVAELAIDVQTLATELPLWLSVDQEIIDILLEATDAILSNRDRKENLTGPRNPIPLLQLSGFVSNEVVDELAAQTVEMVEEIDEEKSQL